MDKSNTNELSDFSDNESEYEYEDSDLENEDSSDEESDNQASEIDVEDEDESDDDDDFDIVFDDNVEAVEAVQITVQEAQNQVDPDSQEDQSKDAFEDDFDYDDKVELDLTDEEIRRNQAFLAQVARETTESTIAVKEANERYSLLEPEVDFDVLSRQPTIGWNKEANKSFELEHREIGVIGDSPNPSARVYYVCDLEENIAVDIHFPDRQIIGFHFSSEHQDVIPVTIPKVKVTTLRETIDRKVKSIGSFFSRLFK